MTHNINIAAAIAASVRSRRGVSVSRTMGKMSVMARGAVTTYLTNRVRKTAEAELRALESALYPERKIEHMPTVTGASPLFIAATVAAIVIVVLFSGLHHVMAGPDSRVQTASHAPMRVAIADQRYFLCAQNRVNTMNACVRRAGDQLDRANECRRVFLTNMTSELARCEGSRP